MYASKYSIRQQNTQLVLKSIFEKQPISRAEISELTGLNKASVSEIIRDLINEEYIIEIGSGKSTDLGGRKPVMLSFNEKSGAVLGIDVGVNSIRYIYSNLDGSIIEQNKIELEGKKHYYSIIEELLQAIELKSKKLNYGLISATISIQGAVYNNKITFTPNYNVIDLENLKQVFEFPIYFENEANLAALSQSYLNKESELAVISLRTGIGAGIIFQNDIYLGNEGGAGELGHTMVLPYGRSCPCGNQGCLERYASEAAILDAIRKAKKDNNLNMKNFIELYHNGDPEAASILDETVKFLSIGIANFLTLYDIPKIYLVSTLSHSIPEVVSMIQSEMKGIFNKHRKIINCSVGKFASAYGACFYSIKQFVENYSSN